MNSNYKNKLGFAKVINCLKQPSCKRVKEIQPPSVEVTVKGGHLRDAGDLAARVHVLVAARLEVAVHL